MLIAFPPPADVQDPRAIAQAVWIDLIDPTDAEVDFVQASTAVRVPTRAALSEIEQTSRIYTESGVTYLSTPLIGRAVAPEGALTPVGFVLAGSLLITVRYSAFKAFDRVAEQAPHTPAFTANEILVRLLEQIVDTGADVLERISEELDVASHEAFHADRSTSRKTLAAANERLRQALRKIGQLGDRISQVRDTLLGVGRITGYLAEAVCNDWPAGLKQRLGAIRADIASLNDYQGHLANKVQFLLDATLGFINIEQNDIVKVLTIASIVGVPPVLVAGIYGMNFKVMPELGWAWGYPYSLILMALSALLPVAWFKWRGWM